MEFGGSPPLKTEHLPPSFTEAGLSSHSCYSNNPNLFSDWTFSVIWFNPLIWAQVLFLFFFFDADVHLNVASKKRNIHLINELISWSIRCECCCKRCPGSRGPGLITVFPCRPSPLLGPSWVVCCRGKWWSSRDRCHLMLTGDPPVSYCTWWSEGGASLCALCAVFQVPSRLHMWQQHKAEGRRGISLQPKVPKVAAHCVQHAAERVLGQGGDPVPAAV